MSEKVLGFKEKDAERCEIGDEALAWQHYRIGRNKLVPVVSVEEIEKVIKERPCKSCKYFTDWLKTIIKEAKKK